MSAQPAAAAQPHGVRVAAVAVFFATIVLAVAAFLVTQRVKHLPTPIARFEVAPIVRVPGGRERISIQLAKAGRVGVTIVDGSGNPVATLVRRLTLTAQQTLTLSWNGREGSRGIRLARHSREAVRVHAIIRGPLVRAGEYHALVHLEDLGTTVPLPAYFVLRRR